MAKHRLSACVRIAYVQESGTRPGSGLLNERKEFWRPKKKFFKGLRKDHPDRPIVDKRYTVRADTTIEHTVEKGETLYSIAAEYSVSVANLKQWNHLTSNAIQIGEKLRVYPKKSNHPTSAPPAARRHSPKNQYTVKSGDTLFRIAQMFQMSVKELKELNHITSNTIKAGQNLKVNTGNASSKNLSVKYGRFTRYTLKRGQSVDSILAKFHMMKNELYALNPDLDSASLQKGEQIEVLMPAGISKKNPYRMKNTSKEKMGVIMASTYKSGAFGPTTNGELYNPEALTAGSSDLKIGTVLFLTNAGTGRGVFVRINDRTRGKELKLSKAAWNALHLSDANRKVLVYRVHE
jgi:LysM repeat protein